MEFSYINPQAKEICQILQTNGYQAYLVGGCVRDLLLNVQPKDWDITTDASPQKAMEIFPKTYPTGLQHGTITVAMGEGTENHFEVTTFRVEGKYKDGRRPEEVLFVKNVEEDLARRDLTINAIAYDPISNTLVDPYHGVDDLKQKIIRAVGDPQARFQEDGLRIMRVARFAARFGYSVDPKTLSAMGNNLETLKKVSRERISDELCKTLMTTNPSHGLMLLLKIGALDVACPALIGRQLPLIENQNKVKGDLETRLAFLYNKLPTNLVKEELINLKLSNKEISRVIFLLETCEKFFIFKDNDSSLAYKGFMAFIKNYAPDPWEYTLEQFIELSEALGYSSRNLLSKYWEETVFSKREMKINGNDLMDLGIKPGPQIKSILDECYLEILQNPKHNIKEFLLYLVKQKLNV